MTRTTNQLHTSRRGFLQTSAAFSGGLMLGVVLPAAGPHTPAR